MGIQDRDYYREGPSFLDRVGQQGATVWLIAITCGIFFGQAVTGNPLRGPLAEIGMYHPKLILEGEVWRLLTSVFLHADLFHLFFNMLLLYWTGSKIEEIYGSREFVLFYLLSGVLANVVNLLVQVAGWAAPSWALGASGAVMATAVVYALHFPHQRVLLFFIIPMPMWLVILLFVGMDLLGAFGARPGVNIGFVVHLAGAAFGLLYYTSGLRLTGVFQRSRRGRVRPRLRVVPPPAEEEEPQPVGAAVAPPPRADEQLEAKLDAVLEKVSKHGPESLTPEEREILVKASELYKKRRK